MLPAIGRHAARLPTDQPRYLMGWATRWSMVEAVALGRGHVRLRAPHPDGPARWRAHRAGRLNLRNAVHARDDRPVEAGCACSHLLPMVGGYLRHLLIVGDPPPGDSSASTTWPLCSD